MAVVSTREIWNGRSGSRDDLSVREYSRFFLVRTNQPKDGPATVLAAAGLPQVFAAYVDANGFGDAGARCISVDVKQQTDEQPYTWLVECKYSSKHEDEEQADDNPLLRTPDREWSFQRYRKAIQKDAQGNPLLNSAREPFDPPVEIDDSRPVLRVTRNEANFDAAKAVQYQDALNSDVFLGVQPGQAKVANLRGALRKENNLIFWEVTYEIEFNWDTWDLSILDQGMTEIDPVTLEVLLIRDRQGQALSKPSLLNGSGERLAPATTTLTAAVGIDDVNLVVTSTANFGEPPFYIQLDDEIVEVWQIFSPTVFRINRAQKGTQKAEHANGLVIQQQAVFLTFEVYRYLPFAPLNLDF